eukprot:PITA_24806
MGNYASCTAVVDMKDGEIIQLVSSDGTVQILQKPLRASQTMQEFPHHLVCDSHTLFIGQKKPPLSPNEQLEVGKKYFLLPDHFFRSELTFGLLASLILPPSLKSASTSNGSRFQIEKPDVGRGLRIRVSEEFVTKLVEDARHVDERNHALGSDSADDKHRLCNTLELRKDYEQLVTFRGQCWLPELETIKEKEKRGNVIS